MGGKSKAQTIGYHYKWAMHFAWCRAADALLELRGGGATAFAGRVTTNTVLSINKPELWGGEKNQGGIVSDFEVLFGADDQAPSDYLAGVFGDKQSGNRGIVTTILKGGRYGAFVPNPKNMTAKFERIHADGMGWYPETAAVVIDPGVVLTEDLAFPATSAGTGPYAGVVFNTGFTAADTLIIDKPVGLTYQAWSAWETDDGHPEPWSNLFKVTDEADVTTAYWPEFYATKAEAEAGSAGKYVVLSGSSEYTIWLDDEPVDDNRGGLSLRVYKNGLIAMNGAHMIYEALCHEEMAGEPTGLINDASFRAAAAKLYEEGIGLCTNYDSDQETPEQFIQRVCNVIGAACSQSRIDGQYYLDLIRGDYAVDSLPLITDADIMEFKATPAVANETFNAVRVEWTDPATGDTRTTAPVAALGRVRDAGETIEELRRYPEVPSESIALRLAQRDVDAGKPTLTKYELTVTRKHRALREGQPFRVQLPKRGIADAVLRLGSIRHGTHLDGRVKIVALQDVFSLPETVTVEPSPGEWVAPSKTPVAPPAQVVFEAPYVELISAMSTADFNALEDDTGFLLTAAALPSAGINYTIASAAGSEDYADRAAADFCPTALVVEAVPLEDPLPTEFTLSDGSLLDRVEVGSWALWGDEIVRVDAIDATAGTCTLGRGCADTVPQAHAAGDRIWFCGDWVGSDGREYVDAEVVKAKLLTRTTSGQLDLASGVESTVTMDQRMLRPYPPAALKINDEVYPSSASGTLTVSWVHRDRVLQADQLVDQGMAGVGPEDGTTYTVRYYLDDTLYNTEASIAGTSATPYGLPGDGTAKVELESVRDGLASTQMHVWSFSYTATTPIDTETTAWESLIVGAGSSITNDERTIADNLIKAIKATSYGAKIVYLLPFIGGSIAAHRAPLRDSLAAGLATAGGSSPFTDADCDTATGIVNSTGKAAYLDTGLMPVNIGVSVNGGLGFYERDIGYGATGSIPIGAYDNAGAPDMRFVLDLRTNWQAFIWGSTTNNASEPGGVAAVSAHYYGQRDFPTLRRLYRDGTRIGTNTNSEIPTGAGQRTIYVMGNNNGAGPTYWKGRCACAYLTDGTMSDADVADFHELLNTYLITPTGR